MAPVPWEPIEVSAYSGHSHPQRPLSFRWREGYYRVESIASQWREPGRHHFLVRTEDNGLFELCYDERRDRWLLLGRGAQGRDN